MSMAKNQQIFFVFRKTTRISKYNKKLVVDNKEIKKERYSRTHETFFKTREQKTEIEMEIFLVMLILQNSLKIKQNFVRKV